MDQEEINMYLDDAKEKMDHSLEHLQKEFGKISTGKATPAMVKDLLVSYYGSPTPMNQVANVSISDAWPVASDAPLLVAE